MRIEHDLLGEREVPDDVYWGVHTLRAQENFNVSGYRQRPELTRGMVQVKKACAQANLEMGHLPKDKAKAIITACDEIIEGKFHDQFVVDVFQGGAGTSANMNTNEVIANRAIEILKGKKGDYEIVHPNNHVNRHQSTNDVVPTAIRVALVGLFRKLPETVGELQKAFRRKADEFNDVLKMGRTQHQDAVPMYLGDEFLAYSEVMKRDRQRLEACEPILNRVNLGGTAIGTGIDAPIGFGQLAIKKLNGNTGFSFFQARNMIDATQNIDAFAAVAAALKVHAANISKITSDLMLLHSGPSTGFGEITLPDMQAGSSIMPGKVNPVIGEMVEQVAMQVISNEYVVCMVVRRGRLELNAFLPLLSHCLFESVIIMEAADRIFTERMVSGIKANREACAEHIRRGWLQAGLPALVRHIGYCRATEIGRIAKEQGKTPREVILSEGIFTEEELDRILLCGLRGFGGEEEEIERQ
jgi:aspartate ammonia-lyase